MLRRIDVEVPDDSEDKEPRLVPATVAASTAEADLDRITEKDLERYIEVTRAEMLFARGVILVEGEAELYLVPSISRLHGVDLDRRGVTVCSVGGIHFGSYVRFLKALKIPFTVVTDGDPDTDRSGESRMYDLLEVVLGEDEYQTLADEDLLDAARANGLFFGESTFELDLLRAGRRKSIPRALADLAPSEAARTRAEAWLADPDTIDEKQVLKDIVAVGKGRFAQRLASHMRPMKAPAAAGPTYVLDAIDYIVRKIVA